MNNLFNAVYLLVTAMFLNTLFIPVSSWASDTTKVSKRFNLMDFSTIRRDRVKVIHLPSGVYDISKTISLPSNTVLEGVGPKTVLRAAAPFIGSRFITNADFRDGNVNITLRSLKVEFTLPVLKGDAPGVLRFENVRNLLIEDLTMEVNTSLYGIDLSAHIQNSTIQKCSIVNRGNGGGIMVRNRNNVAAKASTDITLRHNTLVSSTSDEPLAVFGWLGIVQNVLIEKNHVLARGASFGITVYGIDQPKHTGRINDIVVLENTVKGGKIGGIAVKGGARRIRVSDNLIDGQNADGIFLHTGGNLLPAVQDVTVRKNTISNVGRHCIFATGNDVIVENNTINNCGECGVFVGDEVSVINNSITSANPGILVTGGCPKEVRGNTLRNARGIRVLNNDHSNRKNVIK